MEEGKEQVSVLHADKQGEGLQMPLRTKLFSGAALFGVLIATDSTAVFAEGIANHLDQQTSQSNTPTDKRARKKKQKNQQANTAPKTSTAKAADADNGPQVSNESGRLEGDILVVGLRDNIRTARSAKRKAQQIVDVVLAQDIGKLPDKNVPEALARVPGVQIERDRGEGGKVLIRGLEGVMTTVNGSPTFSAGDRTTYLNDIASDLVAGIEVYKTRTPDQVEGSQTGVINLTLRRPTDFKEGATYSVNVRGDYSDQIKKVNPYVSALVAYNHEIDGGQLGFSVNGTYNDVRYREPSRFNELPTLISNRQQTIIPSVTPGRIYAPARIGFGGTDGWSKRAGFQLSTQWKADNGWTVTLEGGYLNQKMLWSDNSLWIPITYSESRVAPPTITNLVLGDDGRLVKSLSLSGLDPIGPGRESWDHETSNYNGRAQFEYTSDRIEFNGLVNYQRSNNDSNNIFHWIRFSQQPQFDVIFNDTKDPKGGPNIKFNNIVMTDPKNYIYVDGFTQSKQYTHSAETEFKGDLRLNTFWNAIDWFKIGYRYAHRTYDRAYGDRSRGALRLPMSSLPNYKLTAIGQLFPNSPSSSNANWMIGDKESIRASFSQIRASLVGIYPELADPWPKYDPFKGFYGAEDGVSGYGMFHYNVKLLFPIEGTVGARVVNSMTSLTSYQLTTEQQIVDGNLSIVDVPSMATPRGNYLDILPSINGIVHFTPKLQLRLSYTYDVGRPSAYQINPAFYLDASDTANLSGSGGNAKLRAQTLTKYDASLEWYFGSTGSASVAVWQWDQDGLIADQRLPEFLPDYPTTPAYITRPYNLGRGRHRGIEGSATSFFTFLPGILKSFGGTVNGTLNITRSAFPNFNPVTKETFYSYGPYLGVSRYTYNIVAFYERAGLNMRLAYNWRSRQQYRRDGVNPYNNLFIDPVERLDASLSYDITKQLTIALEASNLTKNGNNTYWGSYDVPQAVRYFSRNYSMSVRAKF